MDIDRPHVVFSLRTPLAAFCAIGVALAVPSAAGAAEPPPPRPASDDHAASGIERRPIQAISQHAVPADEPRRVALEAIEAHVACLCGDGGGRHIDLTRSVQADQCPCPLATKVRSDLHAALAALSTAQLADRRAVAEQLEAAFVPLDVTYERMWRYPPAAYGWFIDNVRCVCDGCKPTIFFAKCQLSCAPAIVYKLRARIFLAVGFSVDELIDYYLAEFNAGKPAREQVARDWLLPKKQREKGWLVPALVILFGGFGAVLVLRRWTRKTGVATPVAAVAAPVPAVEGRARARLEAALDEDDDG